MILVIDNYDSFTYNLVQMLGVLGAEVQVFRNDEVAGDEAAELAPAGAVISPGPCGPAQAGNAPQIVRRLATVCPVLGVCLGHQIIGSVFGARIDRAPVPMHGKTSMIEHDSRGVFANLSNPFVGGRYHSLAVVESSLPPELVVTATSDDGVIMGLRHKRLPLEGVQFHPESILTPEGEMILTNFLRRLPTDGRSSRKDGRR